MPVPGNGKTRVVFFLLVLASLCAGIREAAAQTIKLPVTIDYGLLQTLIVKNAYAETNQSVTLLNTGNGCLSLVLSKPAVSEANGLIRFETLVSVHAGTPLGDKCLVPVSWKGYLVLYQRPVIDGKTWKLSFATTSSALLDMNKRPAKIAGVAWNLIKSRVFGYLESIVIDLAPPVNDLKTFLLPLFPRSVQEQTQTMLRTLRTGETRVTPKAVVVDLLADVQEVYKKGDIQQTETLSGKALDDMVGIWEQWDAMLSFMVSIMSRNVLTEEERQTLMDVLLETRYTFVEGLSSQNLTHDFVREQFVRSWRRLSPIFRNHLGQSPEEQTLGYLSFFTAADALSVLDGLGPTFGIEMSRDGLVRMARMLTTDQSILNYGAGVNQDLRKLFQLMPTLQIEKKETLEDREEKPALPEDRKIEEHPISGEGIGDQGSLIDRTQQGITDGKNGTRIGPSEKTIKTAPSDQGHKAVPDKPVERNIETGDLNKQQPEAKPSGQADGENTETQPAGQKEKAELGRLIEQLKQEAPQDGGKSGTQAAPSDQTMKTIPPDQGHKAVPDIPIERDIDIDNAFKLPDKEKPSGQVDGKNGGKPDQKPQAIPDKPVEQNIERDDPFNLQDKATPPEKGDTQQPVDLKDKQTRALQVPLGAMIWDFLFPPAYAGDLAKHDILRWKVPESGVDQYVKRVEEVLNKTSQVVISRGEFPASLQDTYRSMIIAMAWQESCFRQFIEKDHQLTYVLSYNNSSVGLMQVNERVWRGLYDREKLRWDIEYNAAAGNEIAFLYLQKYALRDKAAAKKLEPTTLARLVYAMYNGGPGQYHDFLERLRKGRMLSSDDVFWEKYSLVTSGKTEKLSQCLSGN